MNQKGFKGDKYAIAFIWGDSLSFPQHSHDEYVLSCNISGNETLRLNGRKYEAAESCTTLYNPGQVQAGEGTNCLVSLYLEPDFSETELFSNIHVSFDNPVVRDNNLLILFT